MSLIHLEESFVVDGVTPQQCFDYVTDVANAGEWNTFVRSATAEGDVGVGREIHAKVQFLIPLPFEITTTVTTCEEPGRYTVTSRFPFTADLGVQLEAQGDATACTYFFDMQPTKFFPVPKIVLRRAVKVQFDRDGALLRRRLVALAG